MHCSLLMGDISVAIFLWGYFFFATCFRQIIFFCAKNIFSSHLATMAIGSANPGAENLCWYARKGGYLMIIKGLLYVVGTH